MSIPDHEQSDSIAFLKSFGRVDAFVSACSFARVGVLLLQLSFIFVDFLVFIKSLACPGLPLALVGTAYLDLFTLLLDMSNVESLPPSKNFCWSLSCIQMGHGQCL